MKYSNTFILFLFVCVGCGDTVSSEGSTGDDEGGETLYVDQVPCPAAECQDDQGCCPHTAVVSGSYANMACGPGQTEPSRRWECQEGDCVYLGCNDVSAPCPPDFECHEVDGTPLCILTCVDHVDCSAELGNQVGTMECRGVTDDLSKEFCLEPAI
jgi:hypothetical protein